MFVYKLTCETGKIYYGATKNDAYYRRSKGHYNCSCKDFKNPTIEIVEQVENEIKLYEREKYYIQNYECINKRDSIIDKKERMKFLKKRWDNNNKEKIKQYTKKGLVKINCNLCGKETSKKHLKRHQQSHLCN